MGRVAATGTGLALIALAAASLALAPHAPGYDAWAWLVWGREVAQGGLDTVDGPAFKPGAVLVDAGLWLLVGDRAPTLWLLVARVGALAGVVLCGVLAASVASNDQLGASVTDNRSLDAAAAGVVAAGGVALTAGYVWHGSIGSVEGASLALGAAATGLALDGRHRAALGCVGALGLLRPEAWAFALVYALWLGRSDRAVRPWLVLGAVATLVAWFVPEWLGSGDPLRSGDRARVPNAGAPATADVPAWASVRVALGLPLLPLALAALAAPGRARLPGALGLLWIAEVAVMAQLLGTSGEPRYALPGAALVAVSGAAGVVALARRGALARGALAVALLVAVAVRLDGAGAELRRADAAARLSAALPVAIARAGGRDRVLACGRPVTGRFRGPAVAWALRVPRRVVQTPTGRGGAVLTARDTRWRVECG